MNNVGGFILLVILAATRADLFNEQLTSPSSTSTPDIPTRTLSESSPTHEQQPTPSGRTSSIFPVTSAGKEADGGSVGATTTLSEQTATLVEETAVGSTSASVAETSTSTPKGQTPTSSSNTTSAPVICGPVPRNIHRCIGGPILVKPEWGQKCSDQYSDECELMTCVFDRAGWIKNGVIEKLKLSMDFTEISKTQQKWMPAIKEGLEKCIWEELPPQGVYLKCPAYDVTSCIEAAFVRNTKPSQWSTSAVCQQTKQMISSCPFCPEDCFAPVVPYGSCQACVGLTRQASLPSA